MDFFVWLCLCLLVKFVWLQETGSQMSPPEQRVRKWILVGRWRREGPAQEEFRLSSREGCDTRSTITKSANGCVTGGPLFGWLVGYSLFNLKYQLEIVYPCNIEVLFEKVVYCQHWCQPHWRNCSTRFSSTWDEIFWKLTLNAFEEYNSWKVESSEKNDFTNTFTF